MSQSKREAKRAHWREHVSAQGASGLSGAAYCREHGLPAQSFYRWKRVLHAAGERGSAERVVCAKGSRQREAAPALFAEVRIAGALPAPAGALPSGVEVWLRGGRLVRVARGFDAETLRRAVAALEEDAC